MEKLREEKDLNLSIFFQEKEMYKELMQRNLTLNTHFQSGIQLCFQPLCGDCLVYLINCFSLFHHHFLFVLQLSNTVPHFSQVQGWYQFSAKEFFSTRGKIQQESRQKINNNNNGEQIIVRSQSSSVNPNASCRGHVVSGINILYKRNRTTRW